MHVVTVVGARPQFIKAAVVSHSLKKAGFRETLVHTGQHYDKNMSEVFFRELEISPPNHELKVGSDSHGAQTGRMLEAVERVLLSERPDWVLVYGDTNSTLAGSLAAVKLHIPVAHVEAGLRSFNRMMPEEINRIVTDHTSSLLFAPTPTATQNLIHEGIPLDRIREVGDVMFDAALHFATKASPGILGKYGLAPNDYLLATIHRAESTDQKEVLTAIVDGLQLASKTQRVIWPIHPRTSQALEKWGLRRKITDGIRTVDPVGYLDMVSLEKNASVIATDSGGVQKEAFFHRVPCVTLRSETEWVELVHSGWNRIVPPLDAQEIAAAIISFIGKKGEPLQAYGDGNASARIVTHLSQYNAN